MIKRLLAPLWADEAGFVLSAELILIGTVVVLGLTVAMVSVRDSLAGELTDLSNAFRQIDQSYGYGGIRGCRTQTGWTSWTAGSKYLDKKLREPGSEQDIFVGDHIVGSNGVVTDDAGRPIVTGPRPPCATPCGQPGCPHPSCHPPLLDPPGGLLPPPLSPHEILGNPGMPSPVLPAPLYGEPTLPPDQFGPQPEHQPTPSSDIPPQSRRVPFHGAYPYYSPIPKMIAGPLQVW